MVFYRPLHNKQRDKQYPPKCNTYTYTYAGKTTDSDNEVLKELYVTVTAATASNGNNNQNTNTEAGTATVDYTVASNGTLRYKLNYTAPSYVADNATVMFMPAASSMTPSAIRTVRS